MRENLMNIFRLKTLVYVQDDWLIRKTTNALGRMTTATPIYYSYNFKTLNLHIN